MPHLSPLNWISTPLVFWSILLIIMSNLWWSQSLTFPHITHVTKDNTYNTWNW